jgi:protease-4
MNKNTTIQNYSFILDTKYLNMDFLKQVFATVTGIFVACIILFVVLMIFIGGMMQQASQSKNAVVAANSVLYIDLNHVVTEQTEPNPFEDLDLPFYGMEKSIGLNDILARIEAAKTDDNIKGIYLNPRSAGVGFATLKAIRDALVDFKDSEKFIVAYSDVYSQKAYYLSSVADDIYLHPQGSLDFRGLSSSVVFMKDALDKLGINMQVIKVGTYKSAVEPFMLNEMSPANREQVTSYLNSIYDSFLTDIAAGRGIPKDSLKHIADEFLVRNAEDALHYKFVNGTMYKDELLNELKLLVGIDESKDLSAVSLLKYNAKPNTKSSKNKVAVLYAYGNIVDGEGGAGSETDIGGDRISRELRLLRKDKDVKAVVLRVNSPGGSALASDIIWREVELLKKEKPIVVSMGDLAASGGYYISAAADSIFAEKTTLTGSIGVFGVIPNFKGLLNNKLGIHIDEVNTGKFSDIMSDPDRPMTAEEIQTEVNNVYSTFMQRVADGRNISVARVDSIGQGRVWTGDQAVELGLVDRIGNLHTAVQAAATKAELEDYEIVEFPKQKDPFANLFSTSKDKIKTWLLKEEVGEYQKYLIDIKQVLTNTGIQARIPYTIEIY